MLSFKKLVPKKIIYNRQFIIVAILLLILVFQIIKTLPTIEEAFGNNYNHKLHEKAYNSSQYVTESASWLPDETVYRYAAGYYLQGGSPVIVNSDQPPLAKYIIALSIRYFSNTSLPVFIFFYATFVMIYLLAKEVTNNTILSLLTVTILSFEKILLNQIVYKPLLDIFQLFFIITSFYFFIRWIKIKKMRYIVVAGISLGCVAMTKFFMTALVVAISWAAYLLLKRLYKKLITMTFIIAITGYSVMFISYINVVLYSPNFTLFGIQRWILSYHSSKLTSILTFWPLIYLNRWHTWWGDRAIISDDQWSLLWPIAFTLTIVLVIITIKSKKKLVGIEVLLTFFVLYSGFISLAQATSRYLVPILPIVYMLAIYTIYLIVKQVKKKVVKSGKIS